MVRISQNLLICVLGLALLAVTAVPCFAGVTGKISGRVIDAETGQELPGASVRIDGTTMGNMAGPDGSYFIINVPPATYSVTASLIGYISVTVQDVQVMSDRTSEVTFKLKASAVEVEGVVVKGTRAVIDKGVTANVRTISTDDIKNMPVKEISQILATQVGFVTKANELHIRGGRAGEALYIVDGVETRDLLGGLGRVSGGMDVASSNIEEISVMKGGFDAEYGNVQSAVIHLVTKEGSSKTTSGLVEFITDDFGSSKLNTYSRNSDRLEFSINGPDPFITTKFLPAIGIKFLGEKLAYYFSGIAYKTDTEYDVNEYAPPGFEKKYRVDRVLGFDLPERMSNDYSTVLKLTYRASADKKLVFSHKQNWERYSLYFDPSGGDALQETRGAVNIWQYRYTPSTIPQIESHNNSASLLFTHNVSQRSFYELQISRYYTSYFQRPGDPDNPGSGLNPDQFTLVEYWERFTTSQDANFNGVWDDAEEYLDVNQNGQYDIGEPFQDTNKGKNGVWDPGEIYVDNNGNGVYDKGFDSFDADLYDLSGDGRWNDAEAFDWDNDDPSDPNDGEGEADGKFNEWKQPQAWGSTGIDYAEAYEDGDVNLGEDFVDLNKNGMRDSDESWIDANENGMYDGPNATWTEGVPYIDRNNNGTYDAPNGTYDPGEYYVDSNNNGKWDGVDGFYDRGNERRCYYHHRQSTMLTLKFDFTSQVSTEHQIRTGLMVERMKVTYADLRYPYYAYDGEKDEGPWPDRGTFRDFYTHRPIRGAYYVRDKIEYGAMIANLGFRYDFFIQSGDIRALNSEETSTGEEAVDTRSKMSPRVGVSYPITDKAKVYFNYGHFYQLPELQWMYQQSTQSSGAYSQYGNLNLDYMKQIQYELGVDYAVSSNYKATLSGFYKDYFGQMNTDVIKIGPKEYDYWANTDYGRARGLEAELSKRYGGHISGYINYQYAFAYGKSSSEASNYYARFQAGEIPIKESPLDWDVRHQITLNMDLRVPEGEHPKLFGYELPDKWGLNAVWQYNSGFAFTPGSNFPGLHLTLDEEPLPNSERMPSYSNVNLRFNKDFRLWKLDYSFVVFVDNVFDQKNVESVYGSTGRPDTGQNYFDEAYNANVVYEGRLIDQNPLYYSSGRSIRLGLSMNF